MAMSMSESVMTLSVAPPDADADLAARNSPQDPTGHLPSLPGSPHSQTSFDPKFPGGEEGSATRETQTRATGKGDAVVRVAGDVGEGDAVVAVWKESLRGFGLLHAGSTPFIVKETSVRRLELGTGAGTAKAALARVRAKPDYCQIRKADNRYGLPVDTKFYRVDLDKLPLPSRFATAILSSFTRFR